MCFFVSRDVLKCSYCGLNLSQFHRYTIAPKADINFGSLLVNFKKTRTFTIENNGTFDFKYSIIRAAKDVRRSEPKTRP